MSAQVFALLGKHAGRSVLVDTNILLLYFVGTTRRERISRFGRTDQFTARDFDLLVTFLSDFTTVATTPGILTEVSSFIDKLGEPDRSFCYALFAQEIPSLREFFVPSQGIASTDWYFLEFGLTDCGIAEMAKRYQCLVLTDDAKMANFLRTQQVDVISFDDLRSIAQG